MKKPEISVIIPIYNQADRIKDCLKSIFDQSYKDFEIIVVNDGSTDDLKRVLKPMEKKIKLVDMEINGGAPKARNVGFAKSGGKYIIFCDADIVMKSDMLEKMRNALESNPGVSYVYCSFRFGWKKFRLWSFSAEKLKEKPYIPTTSMIRRKDFPGFDEKLKKFQDWDLWLTMLEAGHEGMWIDEILFSAKGGGTMSTWFPKIFFKLPFFTFGKVKSQINEFNKSRKIIMKKHGIQRD